jgi:hypothetical protein
MTDPKRAEGALAEPVHSRCKAASGGARCVRHCGDPICIAPEAVDAVVRARLEASIAWMMKGKSPGPAGCIGVGDMRWLITALDDRAVAREELTAVLADWNALVKALGSPTSGGAIGYAAALRKEARGLRTGLEQATTALRALGHRDPEPKP